jgi:peptidoglycan/LPS O-acetylase OafA/YrhL
MSAYSIWPYFAIMAILMALVASPLFRAADVPPNPQGPRISTLDGLRGFLALGVFFHHAAIYHGYLSGGAWQLPPSQFYTLLGQVGVAMFFMITGFLFWSRLIKDKGRPDWLQLYVGRIFRIGPLYLFAIGCALAIIFTRQNFQINVPLLQFARELGRWLALGVFNLRDINNYVNGGQVLAYVTWSLRFEWLFYFSLPLLAIVASQGKLHLPFAVTALAISLGYLLVFGRPAVIAPDSVCVALFIVGMTSGSLARNDMAAKIPNSIASVLVGLLICFVFIAFSSSQNAGATLLLGAVFYLIASGCSFFGLLTSRPARRLGDVSYGIYLLQGLIFTAVFAIGPMRDFALSSPLGHWSIVLLCGTLLVIAATAAHVGIERTGIELGKRVGSALRKPTQPDKAAPLP